MKSLLRGSQQTMRKAISTRLVFWIQQSSERMVLAFRGLNILAELGKHMCTAPCRVVFNNKCDLRLLLEHTKEKT